jgi:hypothetical protein
MTVCILAENCYTVSFMLSVTYADCRFQAFHANCRYAERRYAQCHGAFENQ